MIAGSTDSRHILHLDMDSFFVSVERLRQSQLAGRPLLIGGVGDRGVVSACSYETRRFGVQSGMSMRMARRLCPEAVVVKGDFQAYNQYSTMLTAIIRERAPVFEKASIDEFYVDMTGMDCYVGCRKWSQELKQTLVAETGLSVSWGLSVNKTVAKVVANEVKPDGGYQLAGSDVQPYLAILPVAKLPGIGPQLAHTLRCMGVTRLGTLAQIPRRLLERTFGKPGVMLWERANGIDPSPVLAFDRQKAMSKEMTFQSDTADSQLLQATLSRLVESLGFQLRQGGWCTARITIKIRYSDFQTFTRQITLSPTSADHLLIPAAVKAFQALYKRRVLLRLIGVSFSKLIRGAQQLSLFDESGAVSSTKQSNLYPHLDQLKSKHGEPIVHRANQPFLTERSHD
ncbi:DNA polymerase IV [Spirosoma endbachense]|uniref:DNA polymerase IV n=1 Tax=Spirosoma endbachense TaxID=2666025 RepID=A0A6P1W171_9BACT|nr:DNA polymerase IV [Spirosoma endbachense]QHV97767.1 DNA polymerase IV [Spirosoma endbachense]